MARWLGIDIGDRAVRVAVVRSTLRRTSVEAMGEQLLADHESVEAAIIAAVGKQRVDARAVALRGNQGFLRRLTLPTAAQRELASVLAFEVESTLPFELDDAVLDHRVLKPGPGIDPKTQLPILAAVAYTTDVQSRIDLVKSGTGSEPERVSFGPLSLANLSQVMAELRQPAPVAILDLGSDHADLVVLRQGEPQMARTLSRGVSGLPAEASAFERELRQGLTSWRLDGGEPIETLFVVGSGRATPGLDPFLSQQLTITVRDLPAAELDGLPAGDPITLAKYAKAISLALGLSRRATDLNLRRGPLEAQQSYAFLREKTPLLAGLAAAVLVSFGFSVFAELRSLDTERAGLEQQLASATKAMLGEATRDPERAEELLDAALAGKSDDPMPEVDAFDVMVELSRRVPKEIVHDVAELDYNRGAVTIHGVVPTIDDAQAISKNMGEHKCFRDVKITRTTKLSREAKQKYVLEFNVKCGGAKKTSKKGSKTPAEGGKSSKGGAR